MRAAGALLRLAPSGAFNGAIFSLKMHLPGMFFPKRKRGRCMCKRRAGRLRGVVILCWAGSVAVGLVHCVIASGEACERDLEFDFLIGGNNGNDGQLCLIPLFEAVEFGLSEAHA